MEVDLKHLSWLARIAVSEEEVKELEARIRAAKRLIDKLLSAPLPRDVEPLYHAAGKEGLLRDDEPRPSLSRNDALANAARTEKGYFVAPRTLEE